MVRGHALLKLLVWLLKKVVNSSGLHSDIIPLCFGVKGFQCEVREDCVGYSIVCNRPKL